MRTFTESLQVTTNLRMVKESFILMSERGVDPNDFVEWYTTDGIGMQDQGLLTEASEEWLEGKIANWFRDYAGQKGLGKATNALATGVGGAVGAGYDTAKGLGGAAYDNVSAAANRVGGAFKAVTGWGDNPAPGTPPTPSSPSSPTPGGGSGSPSGGPGAGGPAPQAQPQAQAPEPAYAQHAKNAATAVDALSKRMSKSKSLMEKLGGPSFQAAVVNLLNMLRNPSNIVQAAAPTATPAAPASSSADTPSFESTGFGNFTRKIRLHNEIKTGLRTLQQHNIDPVKFVDWYIEEGQYLNEGMFDGVKDWFGRQWANAKGAWGQWGKAGDEYQAQKDQGRDNDAIQQAMHALGELEKGMAGSQPAEDFASVLKQVQAGLTQASQAPAAAEEAPTGPEGSEEQPPAEGDDTPDPAANPMSAAPAWKSMLPDINPDDPASVQQAVQLFNGLPDDQKKEIDGNARKLWVRKGKPSQDQAGADQDKARAMQIMAMGQSHQFNDLASESVQMPKFMDYLKRRA